MSTRNIGKLVWKKTLYIYIHNSTTRKKLERTLHLLKVKTKLYIYVYKELLIIHIKWSTNIYYYTNAVEDVEKKTPLHCWWEYKLEQPSWETVRMLLRKLKIKLPYYSAVQCLVTQPHKTCIQEDTGTNMFLATPFTIAKTILHTSGKHPK